MGCERDIHRNGMRLGFDVQLHESARLAREFRCVRAQCGERLTGPVNHRIEQRRAHVHDARHVAGHERAANTGQRECTRDIQPRHPAARNR